MPETAVPHLHTDPDIHRLDPSSLETRPFVFRDSEFRIVIRDRAVDAIVSHGQSNTTVELCGVLVGKVYRDESGPYLVVADAIRAKEAREESSRVTFTHSSWGHIQREMDEQHPGESIVGWYHMHPGFGVFLSEADLFVHRHFFDAAWQVAIVVDPKAMQMGLFFWENGEIVRARRYWIGNRLCWDPPERLPTSVPPGTGHSRAARAPGEPDAPMPSSGDAHAPDGLQSPGRIVRAMAVPAVLCAVLLLWGLHASWTNFRFEARLDQMHRQVRDEDRRASSDLARMLASWARDRLESGTAPDRLLPVYLEIVRLDGDRRSAYREYLPELERLAVEFARAGPGRAAPHETEETTSTPARDP